MHWRKKWQPTPVFVPGESQGWGSLVGCHLCGPTESDTTEATKQQQQHAPTSNAEEAEVEWFYEDLQDLLEQTHFQTGMFFKILTSSIHGFLEKAMTPQSSTLAWKIPRMEEPGRLQSMGSLRVRHD